MKTKTYKGILEDEALRLASEEFGISEDDLVVKVENDEVEVTVGIDGIEKGKQYIQTILRNNNVRGMIEKRVRDNVVELNIEAGDFNGVLIGKNSKHLIALQVLVSSIINNYYDADEQLVVKVDVGGYRKRRESNLERLAVEYGKQVSKSKQSVTLDGLNSYERKIIHDRLSTWNDLRTHSEGEEPNRFLIIEYVGKGK
jgi:spoIIIJ-associated protein